MWIFIVLVSVACIAADIKVYCDETGIDIGGLLNED